MIDFVSYIQEHTKTPSSKKLEEVLRGLWDNDEFVVTTFMDIDTDEKCQKLLRYIEKYEIDDSSDVVTLCECIVDGVEPEIEFEEDQ